MTTKKRLKEDIESLGYELVATKARLEKSRQAAYKAKQEADKAEQRLRSMQLGIAIGEAIGEGWIQCSNFTIQQDSWSADDYYDFNPSSRMRVPMSSNFSATIDLVGDPNSLMRFGNTLMGK